MVRGARSRRGDDGMRKRQRERESERERSEKGARMELVSLRGVSYRPPLGSAYHEHELSALSRFPSLPSSLTISLIPCFLPNPRRMQTTDANPPANLHLITTITTGDSRETTSDPSPPPLSPRTLWWSFPKRTHGIALRTIGSRLSSLWQ